MYSYGGQALGAHELQPVKPVAPERAVHSKRRLALTLGSSPPAQLGKAPLSATYAFPRSQNTPMTVFLMFI